MESLSDHKSLHVELPEHAWRNREHLGVYFLELIVKIMFAAGGFEDNPPAACHLEVDAINWISSLSTKSSKFNPHMTDPIRNSKRYDVHGVSASRRSG